MLLRQGNILKMLALLFLLCVGVPIKAQNRGSDNSASGCNPPYNPIALNLCLRDPSKLQSCSKRLTSIARDKDCRRQRSLWNCAWHQLRAEECKGMFPLVRSQPPARCKDSSTNNDNVESTTAFGTRGLALWFSCIYAFSSCDIYWSCSSIDAFRACTANAKKLISPETMTIFNSINTLMEEIHQRVRCMNRSSEAVFPYDFKACLAGASQQALSHISSLAKYDPAVSVVSSRTHGPIGCLSKERLEQNLDRIQKDCPTFLQKYDHPSFTAVRDIFETLLPNAEGERCNAGSPDLDFKPVQMCP